MMLLYAQAGDSVFKELKQSLNGRASGTGLESYSNLEDLFNRLHRPRLNLKIGVFSISETAELDRLLNFRELLSDMRLVFVLADDHPQTLTKVHALAPRFITLSDAGVEPLVSVVEKMMEYQVGQIRPVQAAESAFNP